MGSTVFAVLLIACCGHDMQAATRIDDPRAFVAAVYKHLIDSQNSSVPYHPPDDIYTHRVKVLLDRNFTVDGVGCVDFDYWVNAQDWTISDLHITERSLHL